MNQFSGVISFVGDISSFHFDLPFSYLIGEQEDGNTTMYFYGETEMKSSEELEKFIISVVGREKITSDISISTEDKIELFIENDEELEGEYMRTIIEGAGEDFESVMQNFGDSSPNIIAIREAEKSAFFGNRVIKIDIVY
ncbi:hypothetical protein HGA92_04395 [Candidatus Gracilibacteria bacterium]|nr:hypothetical protein [Candidatus Gracilibacteria bacterium]NUJ98526.1 hypothetical protein [Candidatus Gracilibacteria bacterium]